MSDQERTFRQEVAARLRIFADQKGGPAKLAKILKISPQVLNDYLSARTLPGLKMRIRLEQVGCDFTWLTTGKSYDDALKERQHATAPLNSLTEEQLLMQSMLTRLGIKKRIELAMSLDERVLGDRLLEERKRAIEDSREKEETKRK